MLRAGESWWADRTNRRTNGWRLDRYIMLSIKRNRRNLIRSAGSITDTFIRHEDSKHNKYRESTKEKRNKDKWTKQMQVRIHSTLNSWQLLIIHTVIIHTNKTNPKIFMDELHSNTLLLLFFEAFKKYQNLSLCKAQLCVSVHTNSEVL